MHSLFLSERKFWHKFALYRSVWNCHGRYCTAKDCILTAVRVGKTQSNMSHPSAQQTTKSAANPTPIKYRGFSLGRRSVERCTIFQKWSFSSPPLLAEMFSAVVDLFVKFVKIPQSTNCKSSYISLHQLPSTFFSQLWIKSSLDDREQILTFWLFVGFNTTV